MMKKRDYLHQRARKTGTKEDWKVFREPRNRVKGEENKTGRVSFTKDTDTLANEFNLFFTSVGEKAARDLSFSSSAFPRAWRKSVVVLHLKDGDHEIPNNNRPISLRSVLSKLTEKIALNQFNDFLTQQGNLTCHQSGNRKYHSTETLSLLVSGHIFKAMDKKDITAMVLIDLSNAFDSICHRTLLLKLQGLGASSKASKWFQSYLTSRMHSTRLGTSRSEELIVTHGVHFRAGAVQSPHE